MTDPKQQINEARSNLSEACRALTLDASMYQNTPLEGAVQQMARAAKELENVVADASRASAGDPDAIRTAISQKDLACLQQFLRASKFADGMMRLEGRKADLNTIPTVYTELDSQVHAVKRSLSALGFTVSSPAQTVSAPQPQQTPPGPSLSSL